MKSITLIVFILFLTANLTACGAGSTAGDLTINDLNISDVTPDNSNLNNSNTSTTAVVTLNWTPPTEHTDNTVLNDLAGYKIYYGTNQNQLIFLIDIGSNLSSYLIENDQRIMTGTTYYFGITAYDNTHVESAMSNIVHKAL